jgi:hypothetical protein
MESPRRRSVVVIGYDVADAFVSVGDCDQQVRFDQRTALQGSRR